MKTTEFWLIALAIAALAAFAWAGKFDECKEALKEIVGITMFYVTYRTAQKGGASVEPKKEPKPEQPTS